MKKGSISAGLPDAARAEQFETLATLAADGATVERIVSSGQSSPPGFWYDQDWDEWVLIVNGGATLRFESPPASETLRPGDWLLIPAGRRHRVESTEKGTLWLAVHGKELDA